MVTPTTVAADGLSAVFDFGTPLLGEPGAFCAVWQNFRGSNEALDVDAVDDLGLRG